MSIFHGETNTRSCRSSRRSKTLFTFVAFEKRVRSFVMFAEHSFLNLSFPSFCSDFRIFSVVQLSLKLWCISSIFYHTRWTKITSIKSQQNIKFQEQKKRFNTSINTKIVWFVDKWIRSNKSTNEHSMYFCRFKDLYNAFVEFGRTFIEQGLMMSPTLLKSCIQVRNSTIE